MNSSLLCLTMSVCLQCRLFCSEQLQWKSKWRVDRYLHMHFLPHATFILREKGTGSNISFLLKMEVKSVLKDLCISSQGHSTLSAHPSGIDHTGHWSQGYWSHRALKDPTGYWSHRALNPRVFHLRAIHPRRFYPKMNRPRMKPSMDQCPMGSMSHGINDPWYQCPWDKYLWDKCP